MICELILNTNVHARQIIYQGIKNHASQPDPKFGEYPRFLSSIRHQTLAKSSRIPYKIKAAST